MSGQGYVYFAFDGELVKIGYSRDPDKRVRQLQTGCGRPIRLICVVEGGEALERSLHEFMSGTRAKGEWFEVSERMRGVIWVLLGRHDPFKGLEAHTVHAAVSNTIYETSALYGMWEDAGLSVTTVIKSSILKDVKALGYDACAEFAEKALCVTDSSENAYRYYRGCIRNTCDSLGVAR